MKQLRSTSKWYGIPPSWIEPVLCEPVCNWLALVEKSLMSQKYKVATYMVFWGTLRDCDINYTCTKWLPVQKTTCTKRLPVQKTTYIKWLPVQRTTCRSESAFCCLFKCSMFIYFNMFSKIGLIQNELSDRSLFTGSSVLFV